MKFEEDIHHFGLRWKAMVMFYPIYPIANLLATEKALPPFRKSSSPHHVQVPHCVFARKYLYESWRKRYSIVVVDRIYFINTL